MHARPPLHHRQQGLTLIELLVAMAITLFIVAAAAYAYLATNEAQRAIDRASESNETGAFALQLLGREIMNAGFYPASSPPAAPNEEQQLMYDTYPPLPANPPLKTDWTAPSTVYLTGLFGCEGARFNSQTATCPAADGTAADSLVINYFTSDATGNAIGRRADCTGSDPSNDPSNKDRKLNAGTPPATEIKNLPPGLPLFVSNRFGLNDTTMEVDKNYITTKSLACNGNGQSWHGVIGNYQPIVAGVEDLQFSYGVYSDAATLTPSQFYTAAEVNGLGSLAVDGLTIPPWQRVTAVRVCVLTRTLGSNNRINDKAGEERTYVDCKDQTQKQPAGVIFKRQVQVFGVRNGLKYAY